jgi:hypothetical protein
MLDINSNNLEYFINLISFYDTLHDFKKVSADEKEDNVVAEEIEDNVVTKKKEGIIKKFIKKLEEFYKSENKIGSLNYNLMDSSNTIDFLSKYKIQNESVNNTDWRVNFKNSLINTLLELKLINEYPKPYNKNIINRIKLNDMKNIIRNNFKKIFKNINNIEIILLILHYPNQNLDFIKELNKITKAKIDIFYSSIDIINAIFIQRHHIYNLIFYFRKNDYEKVDEILNYFLQDIDNNITLKNKLIDKNELIKIIKTNLKNLGPDVININFPITIIDDMTSDDFDLGIMFKFNIYNKIKNNIDQAETLKCASRLQKIENNKIEIDKVMNIKDISDSYIGYFDISNNEINYKLMDYEYSYQNDGIMIKNNNNQINILVKNNSINNIKSAILDIYKKYNVKNEKDLSLNIINIKNKIDINLKKNIKINENIINHIIFMLFGAKRFGDWSQMIISRNKYFYVKTQDFFAKIYGILKGAPVIFVDNNTIYLYNYLPVDNNSSLIYGKSKKKNKKSRSDCDVFSTDISNNKLVHYNKNTMPYINIEEPCLENTNCSKNNYTSSYNRLFFKKYIKYKNKYFKLKKLMQN